MTEIRITLEIILFVSFKPFILSTVKMNIKSQHRLKPIIFFFFTYQALVVRQHDDYLSVMVPNHPPEVCGGVGQGMLGNDKLITPVVTLRGQKGAVNLSENLTPSCIYG